MHSVCLMLASTHNNSTHLNHARHSNDNITNYSNFKLPKSEKNISYMRLSQ